MSKYKITKANGMNVDFYGAEVGDVIELEPSDIYPNNIWAKGSPVFKEEGWTDLKSYCVADSMEDFLKHAEEIV